jgi:hypothetical protein
LFIPLIVIYTAEGQEACGPVTHLRCGLEVIYNDEMGDLNPSSTFIGSEQSTKQYGWPAILCFRVLEPLRGPLSRLYLHRLRSDHLKFISKIHRTSLLDSMLNLHQHALLNK